MRAIMIAVVLLAGCAEADRPAACAAARAVLTAAQAAAEAACASREESCHDEYP